MISKYNHEKAIEYFERSKYKELEEIISYADIDKMSAGELVELIAFKALVQQKLYKVYWSLEISQLALRVSAKANSNLEKCRYMGLLYLNEAQIIIRNKKDDDRFKKAMELLSLADEYFAELEGYELERLFVKDEKLRTEFELSRSNGGGKDIEQIVKEYRALNQEFDKFASDVAETWQLNAEFHSLRVMAYCGGYPYTKKLGREVVEKFNSRGNKLKALAARIYTLGRVWILY